MVVHVNVCYVYFTVVFLAFSCNVLVRNIFCLVMKCSTIVEEVVSTFFGSVVQHFILIIQSFN